MDILPVPFCHGCRYHYAGRIYDNKAVVDRRLRPRCCHLELLEAHVVFLLLYMQGGLAGELFLSCARPAADG